MLVYESTGLSIYRVRRSAIEAAQGRRHWRPATGGWGTIVAGAVPIGCWLAVAVALITWPLAVLVVLVQVFVWPVQLGIGMGLGIRLAPKPLYVTRREDVRPVAATWEGREATVNPAYLGHLIEAESLRRRFARREGGRSKLVVGALIAGIVGMGGILYLVYASGG